MIEYLNIIRWKNLLFILLIQWLMQHAVLFPILQTYGFDISVDVDLGYLLMLAVIFTAAGGYVINDYFDVKIDRINKPGKVIVAEKISKESTMLYYQILTAAGIISGLVLAYLVKSFLLGFIFILVPGLLWFYAASYKRQFMWGNIVVGFLSAMVIFIVGILEVSILEKQYDYLLLQTEIPKTIYCWSGGFAFFAFFNTWIREIIKDIEDEQGDREMECRTMPIKWGINKSKFFIYGLIVFNITSLFWVNFKYIHFEGDLTLRYIIFGLIIPYLMLAYLIFRAKTSQDFKQASTLVKFIMLVGIIYSLVFYFLEAKQFKLDFFGLFLIK